MRSPVLGATALVLVLGAAACGSSGDAPDASPTAITAPETRALLALCSMRGQVAADDMAGAEATFHDEAHDGLHELADRVASVDRATAGAVLEATSKVEADLGESTPDPATLGADVDGLLAATREALAAADLPAPDCPEASP